jgi:hypothetical protein
MYREPVWKTLRWGDVPKHCWDGVSDTMADLNISKDAALKKRRDSGRQLFQSLRFLCRKMDKVAALTPDIETPSHNHSRQNCL